MTEKYYNIQGLPSDLIRGKVAGYRQLKTGLFDGYGNPISSFKGALSVYDPDVNSELVNELFRRDEGTTDTFAIAASVGDHIITVADGTKFLADEHIVISEDDTHEHGIFKIISVAVDSLILDKPLENDYNIGAIVTTVINSMNVDGSASSVFYNMTPPVDEVWHIFSLTIAMTHTSQPSDDLFGDLGKLINGLLIRHDGGVIRNISTWRDNTDIIEDVGIDLRYSAKSGGGLFGTAARWSFKLTGTVITLDGSTNDSLLGIVQDDLTGLSSLEIKAQGHVEGV
jgi:hypothetical protein